MDFRFKDKNGNIQQIKFKPTEIQQQALDSGINSNKVAQIETNKENIRNKQAILVSGQNIKTINNQSILGSGNLNLEGGLSTTILFQGTTGTQVELPIYEYKFILVNIGGNVNKNEFIKATDFAPQVNISFVRPVSTSGGGLESWSVGIIEISPYNFSISSVAHATNNGVPQYEQATIKIYGIK